MLSLAKKFCLIVSKDNGHLVVMKDQDKILSGNLANRVMELDWVLGKSSPMTTLVMNTWADNLTLHRRLGHTEQKPFKVVFPKSAHPPHCEPCVLSKNHCLTYPCQFEVAANKLDNIHSDLSGIITPPSLGGGRYFFKITESKHFLQICLHPLSKIWNSSSFHAI